MISDKRKSPGHRSKPEWPGEPHLGRRLTERRDRITAKVLPRSNSRGHERLKDGLRNKDGDQSVAGSRIKISLSFLSPSWGVNTL